MAFVQWYTVFEDQDMTTPGSTPIPVPSYSIGTAGPSFMHFLLIPSGLPDTAGDAPLPAISLALQEVDPVDGVTLYEPVTLDALSTNVNYSFDAKPDSVPVFSHVQHNVIWPDPCCDPADITAPPAGTTATLRVGYVYV